MSSIGSVAAIALILNPFGSVSDHLMTEKPWYGFDYQGSVLNLVRVQKVAADQCKPWADAVTALPVNELTPLGSPPSLQVLMQAWSPWSGKDLDAVKGCDDFPCQVKLDRSETEQMAKTAKNDRLAKFDSLLLQRVDDYVKTQERRNCEFPGKPVDPWKALEDRGFKGSLKRPDQVALFARKMNFDEERMLTLHQILDRRTASQPNGSEANVWLRDVYTDHYFDSWGEWIYLSCDSTAHQAVLIQTILADMDLLKSSNFFAHAAFGRYRSAFQDNGKILLDRQFEHIQAAVTRK